MPPHHRNRHAPHRRATIALFLALLAVSAPAAGRAATPPIPYLILQGDTDGDLFGASVAANGDVNGDGFDDIVVGAEWNDADAPNGGRAYVFFGGPGADAVSDVALLPDLVQSRALTGHAVAIVGDVTGDRIDDVAVGAPANRLAGRVFVYAGGPSIDGTPDRVLGGLKSLEFFGGSVSGVGDVNQDGIDDINVGAPWFVPLLSSAAQVGRSYLFYGAPNGGSVVDVLFEGRTVGGFQDRLQFGASVAAAGDVNQDGYADLLVGQPADGTFVAGRAFIYYGGVFVHRFPDISFLADAYRFRAGRSVSRAGDFNADGIEDYVVGAPDSGEDGSLTGGRAYVYFGESPVTTPARGPDLVLTESATYDAYGTVVASGVDVSGDGWADILVGAPQAEGAAGIRAGRVYVYYGGPAADLVADLVLEGDRAEAAFGASIGLGDVNGDGTADAVIGAPGTLGIPNNPGHVNVFDLVVPLPARAYTHDRHRALPLNAPGPPHCLRVEPVGGTFAIEDILIASIRLNAVDREGASSVAARAGKQMVRGDRDGNGVPDFEVCFEREDLRRLFPSVRGRTEVTASLTGDLRSGKSFAADVALLVVGTGPPEQRDDVVSPNPINPVGALTFDTSVAGPVEVVIFDVGGRRVRTIVNRTWMPEGRHRFVVDGRDEAGRALSSGVYFYRIRTPAGVDRRGRFVIAK